MSPVPAAAGAAPAVTPARSAARTAHRLDFASHDMGLSSLVEVLHPPAAAGDALWATPQAGVRFRRSSSDLDAGLRRRPDGGSVELPTARAIAKGFCRNLPRPFSTLGMYACAASADPSRLH